MSTDGAWALINTDDKLSSKVSWPVSPSEIQGAERITPQTPV